MRKETAALVRAAQAPWSTSTHRVQTAAFRRGVLAVLCVGARLRGEAGRRHSRRRRGGRGAATPLPLLPPEVWVCVLSHCTRSWWVAAPAVHAAGPSSGPAAAAIARSVHAAGGPPVES